MRNLLKRMKPIIPVLVNIYPLLANSMCVIPFYILFLKLYVMGLEFKNCCKTFSLYSV